ncbi:MAG: M20/M25/M40 family metallo-hydrolase [Planctomycetes bacterium]|nr:M20/M25/M40 family metallo-hydrolase [Planctomycetota bacterium]
MTHLRKARSGSALLLLLASALSAQDDASAAPRFDPQLFPDGIAERIRAEGIDRSQAMRLLRDLTGKVGHRLTGSDNFTRACAFAMTEFQQMGLPTVALEKWGEWNLAWNRGEWKGRITVPEQIDLYVATAAWTAGTDGPQSGVIVACPGDDDVIDGKAVGGKWVYYSKRPARELRDKVEAVGILGWLYRAGDPDARFPTRVRVFGNSHTAMLPIEDVPTVPEIAIRADQADRIAALLEEKTGVIGEFDIDNRFRDGGIPLYNVVAEIPGSALPDEVVIVCGHLDSWHQAQGCTDNGTGATATMEAARILMAAGAKPKRTIRFCLWGGEEEGLLGSAEYVKRHRAEMDKISAVFNHDTGTNWAQSLSAPAGMCEQLEPVFAPVLALLSPPDPYWEEDVFRLRQSNGLRGGGGSDHASFIAVGVPGLNWGLRGRSNYFQHTWHTQWDTIAVAVPEYQRHTATVIAFAALGTANLPAQLDRTGVERGGGRRGQSIDIAEALFGAEMDGMTFTKLTPDGRAAKMGVLKGDVLTKLEGEDLERLRDIFRVMRDTEGDILTFTLKRGDQFVEVKLPRDEVRR